MLSKRVRYWCLFVLPFVLFICGSKSVVNSEEDVRYIQAFSKLWKLTPDIKTVHQNFQNEIGLIHALQDSVIANIKTGEIAKRYFGDMSYYYTNQKGLCYDRAVLMEKILTYYGFSFRHVYAYFGKNGEKPSVFSLFRKGLSSHALFEVKTIKGWMAVGTNSNWLGISTDNETLTIKELRKRLETKTLHFKFGDPSICPFWKQQGMNFKVVYGLYSRHGNFFTNQKTESTSLFPNFGILPDYNQHMIFYNF